MKKALQIIALILGILLIGGAIFGLVSYFKKDTSGPAIVTVDKTNQTLITDVIDKGQDVDVEINGSLTDKEDIADLTTYRLTANTAGYSYIINGASWPSLACFSALSQDHFFKFTVGKIYGKGIFGGEPFETGDNEILGAIEVSTYVNKYDLNGNFLSREPIKIAYCLTLNEDNFYIRYADAHFGIQSLNVENNGTYYFPYQLASHISQIDAMFTDTGYEKGGAVYKVCDTNGNEITTSRYGFSKEAYIAFKAMYLTLTANGIKEGTSEAYNIDLSRYGLNVETDTEFDYLSADATFNYLTTIGGSYELDRLFYDAYRASGAEINFINLSY